MIELIPEKELELINRRLAEWYGQTEDKPHFRLVWADNLTERRLVDRSPEGLAYASPRVEVVKKYNYIHLRYVLEKLTVVPDFQIELTEKLSYEPVWTWEKTDEHKERIYVRPNLDACRFVIETVLEQMRLGDRYIKYKDPYSDSEEAQQLRLKELDDLKDELFGDESPITDALSVRQGIAYGPGSSPNSTAPIHKKEG